MTEGRGTAGDDRVAVRLLAAGAAAGILLAAVGIVRSGSVGSLGPGAGSGPGDSVAEVNGRPIPRETFARFAGAVAAERKRTELDLETRRRLLDRMVDEELLLQRGIDLGLHRLEPTARRSVVSALIASITADAELVEPTEDDLREFYEENGERFARPGRLHIRAALVTVGERPDASASERADEVARRLRAGEDFAAVARELADPPLMELPDAPVPIETVRRYLGPTPARTAARLVPGEVSDPVRGSAGYYVLQLRDRTMGEVAPFEEVVAEVRSEYLRSRGEEALRAYLADLRESSDVRILDPELAP